MLEIDLSPTKTQSTPEKGDYLLRVEDDELFRILSSPCKPIQLVKQINNSLMENVYRDMFEIKELINKGHFKLIKQNDLILKRK